MLTLSTATFEEGTLEKHRAERAGATGDPDVPLDDPMLDAKVRGLFAWAGLPQAGGAELLRACRRLTSNGPPFALPVGPDE